MKYLISITLLLFVSIISCKSKAQENLTLEEGNNHILKDIPDDIANTTWIILDSNESQSFEKLLDRSIKRPYQNIITKKNTISLTTKDYGEFNEINIDSIIVNNKNGYTLYFKGSDVNYINFFWKNKTKGVASWEIHYTNFSGQGEEIFKQDRVNKKFVTSENFPKPKEQVVVIENDSPMDSKYIKVNSIGVTGNFSCDYKENDNIYKLGKTKIFDNDRVEIELGEYFNVSCQVRKINGTENKYVLFFDYFFDTKYKINDIEYFSQTRPIAEIEIIDSNTIKKKWLGLYNNKTKDYPKLSNHDWNNDTCEIITK